MGSHTEEMFTNSVIADPELWVDNPNYFLSIAPRVSKHAQISDDASLQCQIDLVGRDNVGAADGNLNQIGGSWPAVTYPECLPERLAIVSYMNEAGYFQDDFKLWDQANESQIPADKPQGRIGRQASQKQRAKDVFRKIISQLLEIDPVLGKELLHKWKEWEQAETTMRKHLDHYKTLDEYIQHRNEDVAWFFVMSSCKFGCKIYLTRQEEESVEHVFRPLMTHGSLVNDYFSWDKEYKEHLDSGGVVPLINAVALLMRWDNLTVDEAKAAIRAKCIEADKEYFRLKTAYFDDLGNKEISPTLRHWFDCFEWIAAGNLLWSMTCHRYNSPGGTYYADYLAVRSDQGARWFRDSTEGGGVLTGGNLVGYGSEKALPSSSLL